ncbi:MAG TPA: DoxX family protein [Polyangiaceae bacterium]|nr:DoxX family protein [Polyangiaceae bacterium]
MALGLLILRLAVGLSIAAHGAQKLFGMFGGRGIAGSAGFFETLGFRPGKTYATVAGAAELAGGAALALGLLTPLAAALLMATMIVAIFTVHLEKGFFAKNGGYELPLMLACASAAVAFTGPGPVSLDRALRLTLQGWWWGLIAVGLGLVGSLPLILIRSEPQRRRSTSRAA